MFGNSGHRFLFLIVGRRRLGHVFTADMTGNVVLLGFAVAGAPRLSIARSFTSLAAFLLGAVVGGRVGVSMAAAPRKRWLLAVGISEAAMFFAAAVASLGYDLSSETPASRLYAVIVLTALPMAAHRNRAATGCAGHHDHGADHHPGRLGRRLVAGGRQESPHGTADRFSGGDVRRRRHRHCHAALWHNGATGYRWNLRAGRDHRLRGCVQPGK